MLAFFAVLAAGAAAQLPLLPVSPMGQGPGSVGAPPVSGRPVCEAKPVVARAVLPDPRAYLRSGLAFESGGLRVRVAGSKDRKQKLGFFLAFTVNGDDEPVWVKGGLGKKAFTLRGRRFTIETDLSLLHHERIRLTIRDAAGAVVADFTTGELARSVLDAGPEVSLLGRKYRVNYVEDIRETDGAVSILAQQHTVVLTAYEAYAYDNGRTGYKFTTIALEAERMRGGSFLVKSMGALANGAKGRVPVVYGFSLDAAGQLQVFDLTDYSGQRLPPCL